MIPCDQCAFQDRCFPLLKALQVIIDICKQGYKRRETKAKDTPEMSPP